MSILHYWFTGAIVHYNGVGYCYATTKGVQLTKYYKTVARLKYYANL